MASAELTYPLFDADNHLYETEESLTKYLPKQYKDAIQFPTLASLVEERARSGDDRYTQPGADRGPAAVAGVLRLV